MTSNFLVSVVVVVWADAMPLRHANTPTANKVR